ncbi:hypothetical protein P879_00724 [Paragonimus westermani]|uniref:SEA domain-containing protein n=1 Tax=Paragonimus westermani TaxID=34504 RepID=A0A8T0DHA1_9TREM|nr:hypothetical protein P879_00724 [Paragonimus westermani]
MRLSLIICCEIFMLLLAGASKENAFVPVAVEDSRLKQDGSAFSNNMPQNSSDKHNKSENLYAFRVTGVVFKNRNALPWDVGYEVKQSLKFKNLSVQLCHSVHSAFSQNKTLESAWTNCELLHTKRGSTVATIRVCLDKDLLDQEQVPFNSTRVLTTIKTLLDSFPRAPLANIPYFGVVTCVEGGGSQLRVTIRIFITSAITLFVAQYFGNQ